MDQQKQDLHEDYIEIGKYIYNKPECIVIRRFFLIVTFTYVIGACFAYVDFSKLISSNIILKYENNSLAINVIGGFIITKLCSYIKKSFIWIKTKIYDFKQIRYSITDDGNSIILDTDDVNVLYSDIQKIIQENYQSNMILLSSAAGMGKSTVLKNSIAKLESCGIQVKYFSSGYESLNYAKIADSFSSMSKGRIVIFDEFNDAFKDEISLCEIKRNLKLLYDCECLCIILSFSNEYLADIIRVTEEYTHTKKLYVLNYSKDIVDSIKRKFCELLNISLKSFDEVNSKSIECGKIYVFQQIIAELKAEVTIPLMEIVMLSRVLLKESEARICDWLQVIHRQKYNYRAFIVKKYLMDIVYTSKESDICLIVLYSLAKTSFLRQKLYYKDLQNICFVDNNILMKIIKHLEKFHIIRKVGTNYDENRLIVLASKYWEKHLSSFTRLLLDSSVVHNLDTHFDIKDSRNYIFDSSYDEYQSGLKILKRILCASLGVCVIVNVNNYLKCSELMDYEFFAVLNMLGGLTVFYNYNYVYHFLLPCNKKFYINAILSSLALVGLYYFYDYWFLFWGLGMLIQVASLFILSRKNFLKDIVVFSMIGTLVSVFGYALNSLYVHTFSQQFVMYIPFIKIASMLIVIAVMIGAVVRHVLLTYLINNVMKVKNKELINCENKLMISKE